MKSNNYALSKQEQNKNVVGNEGREILEKQNHTRSTTYKDFKALLCSQQR